LAIILCFVAAVLGTAIRPSVDWLHRRLGLSRMAGVMIIYAMVGVVLAGFFYLVLPLIADQVTQVSQDLPQYYGAMRSGLVNSGNRLLQIIGGRIPARFAFLENTDPTTEEVIDTVAQTILFFNLTAKSLFSVFAVFLLAFYWTQESHRVLRSVLSLIPLPRRKSVREFVQTAETKIGGYVRGQGILSVVVGTAALIAYTLIGLPYALVLAMIAGIMEMVPIFGPALGAIPALLVALSVDPSKVGWVLAATALIQILENAFLVPRIMKNSMGVNPIIILLSLVGFSSVLGFAGALLALPLAAIIQLLIDRIVVDVSVAQARPLRGDLETFMDESQRLLQLLGEHPNGHGPVLRALPGVARTEVRAIVQEIAALIKELKNEEE
jgi:predicted PurR-regulated permease PerM